MRIIIGIPSSIDSEQTSSLLPSYARAIEATGALPLLLPYVKSKELIGHFVSLCDGFLFTGGQDISPAIYGEETKETCGEISSFRDELELELFSQVYKTKKPILAICRGMQLINAALGGSLYQDIPTETNATIAHKQNEGKFEFSHDIVIEKSSPLFSLIKNERMKGNSFHHQAVKTLGEGLAVMAKADDKIIEGYYHTSHPYLRAYQWHPERIFNKDEDNKLIFTDFLSACKGTGS